MVFVGEWRVNSEANWESYGKSNVWCFFFVIWASHYCPLLGRTRSWGRCWAAIRLSHCPELSGRAVQGVCVVKMMDKKYTDGLMNMLGLRETVENLAKASRVQWYRHVLRRVEEDALRKVLSFKMEGQRKRGQPWKIWRRQVEEEIRVIGLWKENALDWPRWRNGIMLIHGRNEVNLATPVE